MKIGNYCPLIHKSCIENKCKWFCQVRGVNPNTGQDVDEWQCAVNLLPLLLIENSQQQRHTSAAVESFRNETVQRTDLTNALLARVSQPRNLVEAVEVKEILPGDFTH